MNDKEEVAIFVMAFIPVVIGIALLALGLATPRAAIISGLAMFFLAVFYFSKKED